MSNKNSLEIAYQNATDLIHKKELKNIEALINPEILDIYKNIDGL